MSFVYVIFIILQWSWGILQNILGFAVFALNRKRRHFYYKGAVITVWEKTFCMGIGMFIFLNEPRAKDAGQNFIVQESFERLKVHEYGHTIQSLLLGPLFLPVIGIPSCLWANLPGLKRYRKKHQISYYSFYTEKWANHLGERITKSQSMGQAMVDF